MCNSTSPKWTGRLQDPAIYLQEYRGFIPSASSMYNDSFQGSIAHAQINQLTTTRACTVILTVTFTNISVEATQTTHYPPSIWIIPDFSHSLLLLQPDKKHGYPAWVLLIKSNADKRTPIVPVSFLYPPISIQSSQQTCYDDP